MRIPLAVAALHALVLIGSAQAQCLRGGTCDPSLTEVRSQLNITVPVTDKASPAEVLKALEDSRHQLTSLSERELEAVKSIYGSEATLQSMSVNSNMQDTGFRGRSAFISMSSTYAVKKPN